MQRASGQTAPPPYRIALGPTFLSSLRKCPHKVVKAFEKSGFSRLMHHAEAQDGLAIKKLSGHDGHWRLRLCDDYRLIYAVERDIVTLLKAGNRKDVYDGVIKEWRISSRADDNDLPDGSSVAFDLGDGDGTDEPPGGPLLTPDQLNSLGIPTEYHAILLACRSEDDLLNAAVPDEILEQVLEELFPANAPAAGTEPVQIVEHAADILALLEGTRTLTDFLLKLDADQEKILDRFSDRAPTGPLIIKGGPGSGKSTLALHCAARILAPAQGRLDVSAPQRVLFATYTNALTRMSERLLGSLAARGMTGELSVTTVHAEAYRVARTAGAHMRIAEDRSIREWIASTLSSLRPDGNPWLFGQDDVEFLFREIQSLILGHGIPDLPTYLEYARTGRKRALQRPARMQVWQVYEAVRTRMNGNANWLGFEDLVRGALARVEPRYDFVFIDEAQDLTPNSIRFCIASSCNPETVYLTADLNQSIYGRRLSWASVSAVLRFQGRTEILRRNYRCTQEICQAIAQLSAGMPDADQETLAYQAVYRGPRPILQYYESPGEGAELIAEFIRHATSDACVGLDSAVILVRDGVDGRLLAQSLPAELDARFMASREFDVDHPGLKVTTIHAAKGLEFPVVVVADVNEGVFPRNSSSSDTDTSAEDFETELRLLHVACSRASRSLMVTASRERPSRFLRYASVDNWDIEGR